MKKTLYITGILLSVMVYGQQEKIVPLSGGFGGIRCNGSVGLCNVSQNPGGKVGEATKLSAVKINETSFQLIVYRKNLDSGEELRIVGTPFSSLDSSSPPKFIVEEDFIMDGQTVQAIGLKSGYAIIPKGKYSMTFDDEKIYITFNLEKP